MHLFNTISHPLHAAIPAVEAVPQRKEHEAIFLLGLLYAIAVCPFIGGVRGWPCTVGWLIFPLLYLYQTKSRAEIGLCAPGPLGRSVIIVILGIAIGVLTAFAFYFTGLRLPLLSHFTLALPALHRSFVHDNIWLFLVLIPAGHFVHELFYRGYLQKQFAAYLGSGFAAILLGALLYAWTHVFIFSSREFQQAMISVPGGSLDSLGDVQRTLTTVVGFSFVESVLAGFAVKWTNSIIPAIAIRSSNLFMVCLLVYSKTGLLR